MIDIPPLNLAERTVTDPWTLVCVAYLAAVLVALSAIDLKTGYLPDPLQIALAAGGLAVVLIGSPLALSWPMALAGAALNGGLFWGLRWLVSRWKGREAMGLGDIKLVAAGGLWVGPLALPYIMAAGGVLTLLGAGVAGLVTGKAVWRGEMPLGPGLAAGVLACFIAGLLGFPGLTGPA
ncbi:MAG: A24 family peptidase [Proteobacteria bacterium]|nr:A24 family peptidase [Pseudomonadota bacterium]